MVASTLTDIENWYRELAGEQDKPKLLSKLAILELCGWIEEWMDSAIREIDAQVLVDEKWVSDNIIDNNHGFHYEKHFRRMLSGILGEHKVRKLEITFEASNPGMLEQIKSDLGSLWKTRCNLAHSDLATHRAKQINFNAPSWTKNQHRLISRRLEEFKSCIVANID